MDAVEQKKTNTIKKAVWYVIAMMGIIWISLMPSDAKSNHSDTLLIIGNMADEATLSGVRVEIFQEKQNSDLEKIGAFISQKEKEGDGYIYLNLDKGVYHCKILSEEYQLDNEAGMQKFEVEQRGQAFLIWVRPVTEGTKSMETAKNSDFEEIEDEEVAQGAPVKKEKIEESKHEENKPAEMISVKKENHLSNPKGEIHLEPLEMQKVSVNVWIILGALAGLLIGIIGLDQLSSRH